MANALARSSSPYLRQHAGNPVDWVPWSLDAFAEARRREVPVLVSIGYATCHWCHVMAHESFEDAETAAAMNDRMVCIKVDREEHPEVDAIYMDAVQALTGHGGWPLNAFCDHQGRPFYACTYLPTAHWRRLVDHLGRLWREDRTRIDDACRQITAHLQEDRASPGVLDDAVWDALGEQLVRTFDPKDPGWTFQAERAPKFPSSQLLNLLPALGRPAWTAQTEAVLEAMQDAGIHDRVGGGFHRYSVDRHWRLPHFEKMLYDNAQLIGAYVRWGTVLGRPDFVRTAINAGDYLLRDLRVEDGGRLVGYAAAEDADDPDGEGSFYAWSPHQLKELFGETDGAQLARQWDIMPGHRELGRSGHYEPVVSHIPHPRGTDLAKLAPDGDVQALRRAWEELYPRLRVARDRRPRPIRDDKVLTDQNAMALEAFAVLGRLTGHERFIAAARELAEVLLARHTLDGLLRLPGRPAYITDYGALVAALPAAFDLLGDPRLIDAAEAIAGEAVDRLAAGDGGFYTTPDGRDDLVRRGREQTDNAWPAGQNALAVGFVRLCNLTGAARWKTLAEGVIASSAGIAQQAPTACATLLAAWHQLQRGPYTAVVTGASPADLLTACRASPDPHLAIVPVAAVADRSWSCLEGRRDLPPQVLVCTADACRAPALTVAAVRTALAVPSR
jgi:uncharacterized protein YyaL (SSP411 family)